MFRKASLKPNRRSRDEHELLSLIKTSEWMRGDEG
jgi:hypothetical protein